MLYVVHQGVFIPVMIVSCLDLSAARSVFGLRANACPWSELLHAELVIKARANATAGQICELSERRCASSVPTG